MDMIDAFVQDLRYGVRLIGRAPGFAGSAILTIALGIAVTTAVFTLVYGIVLRPLAYPEADRLVSLWSDVPRLALPRGLVGPAFYRDWVSQSQSFESLALVRHIANFNLTGTGEPERLQGARITASTFAVLGVHPVIGREFRPDEEQVGHELVVLLSDGLWTRRFGRNPQIVGQTIALNGQTYEIVGVMSPGFAFPTRDFDLWVPLTVDPDDYKTRGNFSFLCFGRLKPGVTPREAQTEMDIISARLSQLDSAGVPEVRAVVEPLRADLVRDVRRPLLTLLAAVASLLLIGCASLANLLIARAVARSGELVLRSALGASRGRLVHQSLTELLPLLVVGGALGLLMANGIIAIAMPWLPRTLPRLEAVTIGAPVVLFAAVLLLFTAVATGIWPALQVARWDVASALRESLRGASTTLHGAWVRDALVVAQISIAVLLTISAALLTRSFINLRRIDPGFKPASVVTMQLAIPRAKYPQDRQVSELCRVILDRVRQLPGVRAAGMVNRLPLAGVAQINRVQLDRSALPDNVTVDSRSVSADYFAALGIPLKSGRVFTDADGADAPAVGLIDEQLARAAWPDRSAIGQRFRLPVASFPWVTIVGIVGHIRHDGLTTDARPQVYWHYLQRAQDRMALVVRADRDAAALVRPIIAEIRAADPEQPVFEVGTMGAVVDRATGQQWLTAAVLTAFAALALLMAAIGVYGVISYGVRLRAREFGIRIALGALRQDVMMMVVRRGATLAGSGLLIGLAGALLVTRALTSLLQDVSSTDVVSFGVAAGALGVAALIATILPARRAVSVDPAGVLRGE